MKAIHLNQIWCVKNCVKILKSDAKTLTKIKKKLVEPLYDNDDVMQTLRRINALDYNKKIEFDANISITLLGNGHLMGACMVLLQISYPNVERRIDFDHKEKRLFQVSDMLTFVDKIVYKHNNNMELTKAEKYFFSVKDILNIIRFLKPKRWKN